MPPAEIVDMILKKQAGRLRDVIEEGLAGNSVLEFVGHLRKLSLTQQFQSRWGLFRQAIFDALDISDLRGLDRDPLDIIDGMGRLKTNRGIASARAIAVRLLREQVSSGNTFFLDVTSLERSSAAVLIPDILETRRVEIERTCRGSIDACSLASTYYGFVFMTSTIRDRLPDTGFERFLSGLGVDSANISCETCSNLDPAQVSFTNTSGQGAELLRAILTLTGKNSTERAAAAEELGRIDDPRAEPYLGAAVKDQYSWVRKAAVTALGQIALPSSARVLAEALNDFDSCVQTEAVQSLIIIGHDAVPVLIDLLSHERRVGYADALQAVEVSHPRSLDSFEAALAQRGRVARKLAAEALGLIGDVRAIPTLTRASLDLDEELRVAASDALKAIAPGISEPRLTGSS